VTIRRATDASGNVSISCTACPLCGEGLEEQIGLYNHLPVCRARPAYEAADLGEIRSGDVEARVDDLLDDTEQRDDAADPTPLLADGGPEVGR